ncbi:MAG: hypothetical protein IIV17_04890, partial [Clostridia bacterium]|nr:hypothetical protein [Clostridia bacterium]
VGKNRTAFWVSLAKCARQERNKTPERRNPEENLQRLRRALVQSSTPVTHTMQKGPEGGLFAFFRHGKPCRLPSHKGNFFYLPEGIFVKLR